MPEHFAFGRRPLASAAHQGGLPPRPGGAILARRLPGTVVSRPSDAGVNSPARHPQKNYLVTKSVDFTTEPQRKRRMEVTRE